MNKSLESALSDEQGQLFELSAKHGLDSETFVKVFMTTDVARRLDSEFNHLQWAGRAYIMEEMLDTHKDELKAGGLIEDKDVLFWIGYIYRRWHFYTGESSKEIYKIANFKRMRSLYLPYHTMSEEMAIDRIIETSK